MSIKLVATWTNLSTKTQDVMLLKTSSITCQRTGSGDTESRAFSNCSSAVSRGTEIKPPYCHCIFIMYSYKWHKCRRVVEVVHPKWAKAKSPSLYSLSCIEWVYRCGFPWFGEGDAIRALSNHLLQVLQAFFNLTAVPLCLDEHGHAF